MQPPKMGGSFCLRVLCLVSPITVQDVQNEIINTYSWEFFDEVCTEQIKTALSRCVVLNQTEMLLGRLLDTDPDWPAQAARLVFYPIFLTHYPLLVAAPLLCVNV